MTITPLVYSDALWEAVADYAHNCPWSAGEYLAKKMRGNEFISWERVFAATEGSDIAGYCTLTQIDCLQDVPYTPYIGFMFVDEKYRGKRLSGQLIRFALDYAGQLGYDRVYIVSEHVNLYEKFGFKAIDSKPAPWNPEVSETVFMYSMQE